MDWNLKKKCLFVFYYTENQFCRSSSQMRFIEQKIHSNHFGALDVDSPKQNLQEQPQAFTQTTQGILSLT